jgi:hypothetical protein
LVGQVIFPFGGLEGPNLLGYVSGCGAGSGQLRREGRSTFAVGLRTVWGHMRAQHSKSVAIFILSSLLLAACGTIPNGRGPERISSADMSGQNAIVLMSTSIPANCGFGSFAMQLAVFHADTEYHPPPQGLAQLAVDLARNQPQMVTAVFLDNRYIKSDFADHPGNLNAIVLAPGSYYFAPTVIGNVKPEQIPKYDFAVSPGEVVYMGQFTLLEDNCRGSGRAKFLDEQQRDLQLLAQKNPELARANIVKRIPVESGMAVNNYP